MEMESAQDQFPVGLRVLVVDDDPTCLFILERMLQRCFYNVTTCGQATIALAMLRQNKKRFDLVISDVHMPDMDGFKLLELIGLEMNIPVIMMSVDGEFSVVLKGVMHGACDYLLKPIRIEALRNIWQHVIRKKQLKSKEVEGVDTEDMDRLMHGSETLEFNNSKKRKDIKDTDLDAEDQSTLKKQRVVWSMQLHEQFVSAVKQLGIDKAVPKRILEVMNVQGLTRENVASHLQKYRLYLKRLSYEQNHTANLHYAELKGHSGGAPFWIRPEEFLMPTRCNELSPTTFATAHSVFANGLSFPNNSGLVGVDPPPGYAQISAIEETHTSPSQLLGNASTCTMEDESLNPNRSELTQIMPTISAGVQAPNSDLNDLITEFSQQINQQDQRCSLQRAIERFDASNRYSMTLAESNFNPLHPSHSAVSKESFCQHADPLGTVLGGHLTETAFEGLSMHIIPNGKENLEYPSELSSKTMGISEFEDSNFADVKCSFDLLNPPSCLSPSAHPCLQNRMDAQNSELAMKLQADLSMNTKSDAAQSMKVDWETRAACLWQGADRRSTSGAFACSTQVSRGNNVASHRGRNVEIVHAMDGLGSDLSKKDDGILVQYGKLQGDFEHSAARANMNFNGGHQVFTSGIKEKKESGNVLCSTNLIGRSSWHFTEAG